MIKLPVSVYNCIKVSRVFHLNYVNHHIIISFQNRDCRYKNCETLFKIHLDYSNSLGYFGASLLAENFYEKLEFVIYCYT